MIAPRKTKTTNPTAALKNKQAYDRQYQADGRRDTREVGPIDECVDPVRRESTRLDFIKFCEVYFPAIYVLPWSDNHRKATSRIETAVLEGGLFAFAMPRASGKTSLCEQAALWSLLHAHHGFVLLIGATESKAKQRLRSIQVELTSNQLLRDDFPEIMQPIHHLGTAKKLAEYQTQNHVPTCMKWTTEFVIFPTVTDPETEEHFPTSGSMIQVAGITGGEIRGLNHKRQDGSVIRPTLAIADDPQTRDSAKSPTQSDTRTQTLAADIAYCSGPGQPISVIVPCTVIYQGDMAEKITDRGLHPEYQGIRTKLVEEFPANQALWDQYTEILKDSLRNDGGMEPATEFYRQNRKPMDAGAVVSWKERFGKNELSAVQHAMNLLIRDEAAFWSECQNEPLETFGSDEMMASQAEILAKVSDYSRFVCPKDTTAVTSFIDIQMKAFYYATIAWQPDFSGQVIDYGVWPEQGRRVTFALSELRQTFDTELPNMQLEAQIYNGLKALVANLCGHSFPTDGGGDELRMDRVLIDANWGQQTNTVYQFCRECQFGTLVTPSHGKYVGATSQPWSQWRRKKGERVGPHWRLRASEEWPIKHVIYDTNHWKTFIHQRLKADFGGSGTLGIFGRAVNQRRLEQRYHQDLANQLTSEIPIRTEAHDRVTYEWKLKANRPDNHFLDCLVGASVAASMSGIELDGSRIPRRASRKPPVNFRDAYLRNVKS